MANVDKSIDKLPAVSKLDRSSLLVIQQGGEAKKLSMDQLLNYVRTELLPAWSGGEY